MDIFFDEAFHQARQAFNQDCVPVGAILVYRNSIISKAHNQKSPLEHAELLVLSEGISKIGIAEVKECQLYVTLEPCEMCKGAISLSGIKNIYFGAYNSKSIINSNLSYYGGFRENESEQLLKSFFQGKRDNT